MMTRARSCKEAILLYAVLLVVFGPVLLEVSALTGVEIQASATYFSCLVGVSCMCTSNIQYDKRVAYTKPPTSDPSLISNEPTSKSPSWKYTSTRR